MKKYLLAGALFAMTLNSAFAEYYLHTKTNKFYNIYDIKNGTAAYYDYETSKKMRAPLDEFSKETYSEINGIKSNTIALLKDSEYKACDVFHVFENGHAYVGCQTTKMTKNIGVDRPRQARGIVSLDELVGEIQSLDGLAKKDKMILLKDSGNLEAGTKVRVEVIFPNGEVLIQKMGANLLDTSNLLLKKNIEKVHTSDLGH